MNYLRPELLDRLAASFALGTLTPRAARRFVRVLRQSRAAQHAVDHWHQQLNGLAVSVPPLKPSAAVWSAIARRTTGAPTRSMARSAWWLPSLGLAAGAMLAVGVARIEPRWLGIQPASTVSVAPAYVGVLTAPSGAPVLLASSLRQGKVLTLKQLQPLQPPGGYVAQLWALPRNNGAPILLGAVPAGLKSTLTLNDTSEKLFADVGQLAVSYEPAQGIKSTQPSVFVLQGPCVKLW